MDGVTARPRFVGGVSVLRNGCALSVDSTARECDTGESDAKQHERCRLRNRLDADDARDRNMAEIEGGAYDVGDLKRAYGRTEDDGEHAVQHAASDDRGQVARWPRNGNEVCSQSCSVEVIEESRMQDFPCVETREARGIVTRRRK